MNIFRTIAGDFRAASERDPAARGFSGALAILLCYPGFKAIVAHRVSHVVWRVFHLKLIARMMSQTVRFFTGVEIHPAAVIGHGFFIDHGHGVVIGETTIIGDNVTLYQGVTLGGTGKETGKRHPTVEDDVVVGAGAKVLGNVTLGRGCKVGAGSVVVRDVPHNTTVVGVPAVIVKRGCKAVNLDHTDLPNPFHRRFENLQQEFEQLHRELEETRRELERYREAEGRKTLEYEMAEEDFQ